MAKYISKEKVLNLIEHNDKVCHYADERYENVVYATTQAICGAVAEMPAAEVPSSVKETKYGLQSIDLVKLHLCTAEIFRETQKIERFAYNWDKLDPYPFSADYEFIIESLKTIRALDKQIHNELFPKMSAETEKEDK